MKRSQKVDKNISIVYALKRKVLRQKREIKKLKRIIAETKDNFTMIDGYDI